MARRRLIDSPRAGVWHNTFWLLVNIGFFLLNAYRLVGLGFRPWYAFFALVSVGGIMVGLWGLRSARMWQYRTEELDSV
jgi:Flp pilus assembly protein TadB